MKTNGFNSIKVGTIIIYRLSWGTGALTKAKVRNIELCKNEWDKYGERVNEVSVNDVNRSVFDLDDGHWCYGYQVEEIIQHAENMKYGVGVTLPITYYVEVEAKNEDEAKKKALQIAIDAPLDKWNDDCSQMTAEVLSFLD